MGPRADLAREHCPLGHVGLEGTGRVVEEEAHAERREALIRALVHVGPVVQQQVDDVSVAVNLEGGGQSQEDRRLPPRGVRGHLTHEEPVPPGRSCWPELRNGLTPSRGLGQGTSSM